MVAELRHLVFSQQEVVTAVFEYRAYRGQPLPKGTVKGLKILGDDPIQLQLEIVMDGSGQVRLADLIDADVTEALVLFCRNRKIPLPKSAEKAVRRIGGTVALMVSKNIPLGNVDTARQMLLTAV